VILAAWFAYLWSVSGVLTSIEKYPNGAIKAEGFVERFHGGEYRRTGYWKTYHSNGKKESEGMYTGGKQQGTWEFWNEQGEAMPTVEFHMGQQASPSTKPS
jgi:antitoxin component YwqK of YwqJK toxin-antitoxin module